MVGNITGVQKAPEVPDEEVHEGMVAAIVVHDNLSDDTMAWRFGDVQNPSCVEIPAQTVVPVELGNFRVFD